MTRTQLNEIKPLIRVIVKKGHYNGYEGYYDSHNEVFLFISIENSMVLFPIEEYLEYIDIIEDGTKR